MAVGRGGEASGLIGQALQLTRGLQRVLDMIARIEHDLLGRDRRRRERPAATSPAARISSGLFGRERTGEGVEDGIHILHSLGFEEFTREPASASAGSLDEGVDEGLVLGLEPSRTGPAPPRSNAGRTAAARGAGASSRRAWAWRRRSAPAGVGSGRTPIEVGRRRLERAGIGQEDLGRTALDQARGDRGGGDVVETLGREDHADALLSQGLEPFADLGRRRRSRRGRARPRRGPATSADRRSPFERVEQGRQDRGHRGRASPSGSPVRRCRTGSVRAPRPPRPAARHAAPSGSGAPGRRPPPCPAPGRRRRSGCAGRPAPRPGPTSAAQISSLTRGTGSSPASRTVSAIHSDAQARSPRRSMRR
jgi:hypothetical protein